MPNQYLRSLVVALALLFGACSQQAPPETESIDIDSSSVQIVTSTPASSETTCTFSEEPVLVIGDNEEDDNQWFSMIRGMGRLSDGSVAVVDRASAEVRIFDASGRHLRSMGQRGEGPGEFTDAFILWVTAGDTLWVGNTRPWSYTVFTAQGQFVRRIRLEPVYPNPSDAGGVLENGYTVNARRTFNRDPDFGTPDTLIVEIHDPDGTFVRNLARIPQQNLWHGQ
ncbi:MAG: 6-bladed beta-propeller [Bacteroidota bacterium]|nr:6-bladed beta-propeller [Bacteroidota bacterium]